MGNRPLSNLLILIGGLVLLTNGCNMPRQTPGATQPPAAVYTAAAQTVAAQLTADPPRTPGGDQTAVPTATLLPATLTPSPTPIIRVSPSATPEPCDQLTFIKDVNYPDGSDLLPGEEFTKTWRLENSGSCTWTPGYSLVFDRGDALGGPASMQLSSEDVEPGDTVDVSVDLQAPEDTGTYQGYWKLRNTRGEEFGHGEESKAFWVKIDVVEGSGVMFDFNVQADAAAWGSGSLPLDYEGPGDNVLIFSSAADAGDPFVVVRDEQKLEGNTLTDYVLVTYPGAGEDVYVIGRYPDYQVNPGDALSGRVGLLLKPDDSCGSGDVTYRIDYTVEGDLSSVKNLWKWSEICDGETKSIQIPLNDLEGKKIQFYLVLIANTSSEENYAVWDSLAIKR